MQQNIITDLEAQLPVVGSIPGSGVSSAPAQIAQELAAWSGKTETDPTMRPRLSAMWENINYGNWTPATAWSSAFVSWVLRGSGFPGSSAHRKYTEAIISGEAPGWRAYSIPKNLAKVKLEPGDVLVRSRGSATPSDPTGDYWKSHGGVVYRLANGRAEIVGGNMSGTVKVESRLPVDSAGRPTAGLGNYQVILKRTKKNWLVPLAMISLGAWWVMR